MKRSLVDCSGSPTVSRQCELLSLPRSTFYYKPHSEHPDNLQLMHAIDRIYTKYPIFGTRRMTVELQGLGFHVGRDRVRTLMRKMGLEPIYPKKNLSRGNPDHKIYPYLLRGVKIERVNQVWSTDITYLRMASGFLFLSAVIDWYSRYVLSWRISNTLDGLFCREALLEALTRGQPEIFNTDQGVQFTAKEFVNILISNGITPSMDGKGRALDNVYIERLWRSVKYENVYLNDYHTGMELHEGLDIYFKFYNTRRRHMSLNYETPETVFMKKGS